MLVIDGFHGYSAIHRLMGSLS